MEPVRPCHRSSLGRESKAKNFRRVVSCLGRNVTDQPQCYAHGKENRHVEVEANTFDDSAYVASLWLLLRADVNLSLGNSRIIKVRAEHKSQQESSFEKMNVVRTWISRRERPD